jgi:energy-coupling factor transporter ATP-binding protein EcfA2
VRVSNVRLRNFRRLEDYTLSFLDDWGAPRPVTVVVGPNGSGKSSILQALAATLGTATGRISSPEELVWPGFVSARVDRHWKGPCQVDLTVISSSSERQAIAQAAGAYQERFQFDDWTPPDVSEPSLRLTMAHSSRGLRVSATSAAEYFRFRGRAYAQAVVQQLGPGAFDQLGTVLWYTEQRETWSLSLDGMGEVSRMESLDRVRAALLQLENDHLRSKDGADTLFARLNQAWQGVFPGRTLVGGETRDDQWRHVGETPGFLLSDESGRTYELAEMSGAERAVFPLLFDLVRWRVHESVVLIDELELHLHPPLQQALVTALPSIGKGNQYIITTHSQHVVDVLPSDSIARLETL